jgi:hypothetical protein
MRVHVVRATGAGLVLLALAGGLGGCPSTTPVEFIAGGTGEQLALSDTPSVTVLTPADNLSITGGTPVEVDWRAVARSRNSVLEVQVDGDEDPNNGDEVVAVSNLTVTETTWLLDTTALEQGTYHVGVVLTELGQIVAFGYAPGLLTINQRPQLFYLQPSTTATFDGRGDVAFDRTSVINPHFTISWELDDPDSTDTVDIYFDPDDEPNGDEVLLFHSTSQTGDTFSFDLPTMAFAPGVWRILALVNDGTNSFPFYAPGSIRLRARLAGAVDLRNLNLGDNPLEGAIFEGFNPRDNAGSFVSSAGDIDGDGFGDFLILSQFGKPNYIVNTRRTGVGEAYMIYGRAERFRGVINLNSTGVLMRGEIYEGVEEMPDPIRPTRGIASFTVLSDWDGDGVREFAFGLPFTDSLARQEVLLDNDGAFRTGAVVIAAGSSLEPSQGFPGGHVYRLAEFGYRVHTGLKTPVPCPEGFYGPNAPSSPFGGPTLYFWHLRGNELPVELSQLGARILTNDFADQCGETVSAYPSNGLLISVPNRDPIVNTNVGFRMPAAGVVSLYFAAGPTAFLWNDNDLELPHHGPFRYILDDQRLFLSNVGRVTGSPGFWVDVDDAIACLPQGPAPYPTHTEFVNLIGGVTPTWRSTLRIYGGAAGASIGLARTVGDFSADGLMDFVIGSPLSNEGAGACFIVLGRHPELMVNSELAVEELGLPMNSSNTLGQRVLDGIRVIGGPDERLGTSEAEAGDFNNDGIADVLIGSPFVNNRQGGAAVFFGSRTVINLTEEEIPFDELAARGLGVIFVGERDGDLAGAWVSGAGDVDGDGNDDILIAAPDRSVRLDLDQDGYAEVDRTACGVVYLVYGAPDLSKRRSQLDDGSLTEPGRLLLRDIGTEALPGVVFIGRNSGDHLGAGLGTQGDRSHGIARAGDVDGDGRGDMFITSVSASPRDRAAAGEAYLIYGVGD